MAKKSFENVSDDIFSEGLTAPVKAKEIKQKQVKKDSYKLVFAVDDDLTEYFNNIMWIKRNTKSGYLNDLIRQDFIKTIGLNKTASNDDIMQKWNEYKKENRL
jgi:hypothetical protein